MGTKQTKASTKNGRLRRRRLRRAAWICGATGSLLVIAALTVLLVTSKKEPAAAATAVSATPDPILTPVPTPTLTPTPTPSPTPIPTPTPTPAPRGLLDWTYDAVFSLDGTVETATEGVWVYRDADISVTVTKYEDVERVRTGKTLVYFVTDIYLQDATRLCRAQANGDFFSGKAQPIVKLSATEHAIVAISGDYAAPGANNSLIWADGELVFDSGKYRYDLCVLYRDGHMETYSPDQIDPEAIAAKEPWASWCFGPILVTDGTACDTFNGARNIAPRNPRSVLGYYEPGHYCFVLVEGRTNGYSMGLSLEELAALMQELGVASAYNLDGGISAQLYFGGSRINKPGGTRSIRDVVYIAYPDAG